VDFQLYGRVLWRFRLLVLLGLVLATALAILSIVKVSADGVTYRQTQLWSTDLRLLVTQKGFPEGRLYAQKPNQPGETSGSTTEEEEDATPVADPARFNTLAILYAELATSDPVRQLMIRDPALRRQILRGQVVATPLRDAESGVLLPLIDLIAIADSPRGAVQLALGSAKALNTYISGQQRANNVPAADRVVVQTIEQPRRVQLFQPRSKTMAIVVFLAVMFATVGLAFVLENARPRQPGVRESGDAELRDAEQRRTA
jgi:hypothetical protein